METQKGSLSRGNYVTIGRMKIIERALRGAPTLVFLDLEATQISHETIEIGAIMVDVEEGGRIRKKHQPFTCYVQPKNPIGRVVRNMTGIDEKLLREKGVPFKTALELFRSYLGHRVKSCLYLTWGPSDISILEHSLKYSPDGDELFIQSVKRHHLDFQAFLKTYVQDANGNPLSLHNAMAVFGLAAEGHEHDASTDAMSLERLYEATIASPAILEREYAKTLSHFRKLPLPLLRVLNAIHEGETVDREKWISYIRETFK